VERQRVEPVEAVGPRRLGYRVERVGGQLRRQARRLENAGDRGIDGLRRLVAVDRLQELPEDARIAQRAVTVGGSERMARDERVEIVPGRLRIEAARKLDGAQDLGRERAAEAAELVFQEA